MSNNIKKAREKRGMTQVRLSTELGIAQETISGYEIERIKPSTDILCKIADVLNVSTDYLLCRINENTKNSNINITEVEEQLLFDFRLLNEEHKQELLWYVNVLKEKENIKSHKK